MGFEEELDRMMKDKYNFVQPTSIGTVLATDGISVTVKLQGVDMEPFQEVPVLKPPFADIGIMDLVKGDTVLLAFIQGSLSGPIVIGRL